MQSKEQPKLFYGWVVVFAILCVQGAAIGVLNNTMSIFIRPVSEALNVSRSTFYLHNTFGMIAGMLMSPVWGEFFRNRRFKPWMVLGSMVAGGSVFAYSMATSVAHFYAISVVNRSLQGMLMGVPIARILSNWFIEKRGLATGIALSGSGLAGAVMTPIASRTIEAYGWRTGYRQLGIIFFMITVPVLILLLKEKPEDMGLKPLGYKESEHGERARATGLMSGISRAQAFKSKTFWCYVVGLFLMNGCTMSTSNNVVNYLTDIGHSPAFAASIFSLLLFMLVPGKPVLGYMYDKLGMMTATIVITVMLVVSPALLACTSLFPAALWVPYAFALVFGFAYSSGTMQMPYMTPRLFGDKEFSRVYGVCQSFSSLGMALLVPVANKVQEMVGSFVPIFFTLSGAFVVALWLMTTAIRMSPIEIEKFDREDGLLPAPDAQPALASS